MASSFLLAKLEKEYNRKPAASIGVFVAILLALPLFGQQHPAIPDLVRTGRLNEAAAELERATRAWPNDAGNWNLLGVVRAQQGDLAGAESAFRKAATLAPADPHVWLNLGRLYTGEHSPQSVDKGVAAYSTVLKLDPGNAEAHHQIAFLLQSKGDFRGSLKHLDQLPSEDQERLPSLLLRCAAQAALGQTEAALVAASAILRDPNLTEADVVAILPVVRGHDQKVELRLLEGLEQRGLSTGQTAADLGAIYEKDADLTKARSAYERAAQAAPSTSAPLMDLARIAWKQKDYEGVLGYLGHARDLDPKNPAIHFFFGLTCNELNLPVEAKRALETATELAPDNPVYSYAMGAILLEYSDRSRAVPYLRKFVAARPDDPRGHLALATAYFATYDFDAAKAELAKPVQAPETKDNAEYLLGRIAAQDGDLPTAITHFRKLVVSQPNWPEAHAELAAALFDQNDTAGARKQVDATLALDPENYLANNTLLKLYKTERDPRVQDQIQRLRTLIENRDARVKLMQRTIEVRPY